MPVCGGPSVESRCARFPGRGPLAAGLLRNHCRIDVRSTEPDRRYSQDSCVEVYARFPGASADARQDSRPAIDPARALLRELRGLARSRQVPLAPIRG